MKWIRFTIKTKVDAVDVLSYELDQIGVEGIEIEDHLPLSQEDKEKMFVDILPDPEVVDDIACVHFYIDEKDCHPEQVIAQVNTILSDVGSYMDIGEGTVSVSETEDKDWINNWKQYFKPFRASDRLAICPTWIEEMDAELMAEATESDGAADEASGAASATSDRHVRKLLIDPGIAFGTGSHETTKLCIQALDRVLQQGDNVLDIGCGSGILSIASLLLDAEFATAIDIDEIAVKVAKENFDVNNISEKSYELIAGNLIGDEKFAKEISEKAESYPAGGYDIVVANILPDVIVPLTPLVPAFLKKDGIYITSGILATRADEVREALEAADFTDITCTPMGEWVAFCSRKK